MTYDAAKRVAPMGTAHAAAHRFIVWISQSESPLTATVSEKVGARS
jgi:hypothetical protein